MCIRDSPHIGHHLIRRIQSKYPNTAIITQNIDGMHQRANSNNVIELHGSLWKMRGCSERGKIEDLDKGEYADRHCDCGQILRPDIIWFQDMLDEEVVNRTVSAISKCSLFISIGTSASVWPAAGFPRLAREAGAYCIEINPEETELSSIYDEVIRQKAGKGLELCLAGM